MMFSSDVSFTDSELGQIEQVKEIGQQVRELKQRSRAQEEARAFDVGKTSDDGAIQCTVMASELIAKMDTLKLELEGSVTRELRKLMTSLEQQSNSSADDKSTKHDDVLIQDLLNLLPQSKTKKKFEKQFKAIKKAKMAAIKAAFDRSLYTDGLRVQRKIHHLLESTGSGESFRYSKDRLATEKHGIVQGQPVVLTEKWDGTTVQATNKGIFKRTDNFAKGDMRKFGADEDMRYDIKRLHVGFDEFLANRANSVSEIGQSVTTNGNYDKEAKYIRQATEKYFPIFANLENGLCVYFEAVGTHIMARYNNGGADAVSGETSSSWHDIRVFDFCRNGKFLPWSETCTLAESLGLPVVGYTDPPAAFDLDLLLEKLASGLRYNDEGPAGRALLEGYVIRGTTAGGGGEEEEPIAKIRVDDVEFFVGSKE